MYTTETHLNWTKEKNATSSMSTLITRPASPSNYLFWNLKTCNFQECMNAKHQDFNLTIPELSINTAKWNSRVRLLTTSKTWYTVFFWISNSKISKKCSDERDRKKFSKKCSLTRDRTLNIKDSRFEDVYYRKQR